jgi:signal transduction histidine kinase
MKILIYNLVSNSIRYSDKGTIVVDLKKSGGGYVLSVSDQGIGMSEAKVESLLTEAVTVREKSAEKRSGHGLGYLIIRDLVKWMQANMQILSTPGVGTEVRVFLRSVELTPSEMA